MIKALTRESTDQRISNLIPKQKTKLIRKKRKKSPIHIVYVMGNTGICGAAKIIFQQANEWVARGRKVTIVAYGHKPTWYPINCSYIQVPSTGTLATFIPYCNLIIATYYTHISECVSADIAPVVYFEQGDQHLFNYEHLDHEHQTFIQANYRLAHYILTVSHEAAKYIKTLFGREALVIHNGIDTTVYKQSTATAKHKKNDYILMMGNDRYGFKGIKDIIAAYGLVKEVLPQVELYFITPEQPTIDVSQVTKVFVAPEQSKIIALYQEARVFIQGSYYEAFGLPVLEAMACGCPVITTDCIGIRDYVSNEENAIVERSHSPRRLADRVVELNDNYVMRRKILGGGLKTARRLRWKKTSKEFISIIENMATFALKPRQEMKDWDIHLRGEDFVTKEGYAKFLQYLQVTDRQEVYVPVRYEVVSEYKIARWEVGATRCIGGLGKGYCYAMVKKAIHQMTHTTCKDIYGMIHERAYDEAISEIKDVLDNDGNDSTLRRWLIYCLIKTGRVRMALDELSHNNREIANTDYDYLYLLAYNEWGETDKALDRIRQIRYKGDAITQEEFIVNIIDVVSRMNRVDMTIPKIKKEGVNELSMEEIYNFALQLYDNGLYEDAIYYFLAYIDEEEAEQETCIEAYRKVYLSYYHKERYDMCRRYCYKIFEYTNPRAEECCFIGYTLMKNKRFDEAIFWYQQAADLKLPRHYTFTIDKEAWSWKPYLQLCMCYYEKGDIETAFANHEKARKLNPHDERIKQNIQFFESKGYCRET